MDYISINEVFKSHPLTQEQLNYFDNDPNNFLAQMGLKRSDVTWRKSLDLKDYAPYYRNLFHLSSLGHAVLSEVLAQKILKMEKEKKWIF